MISTRKDPIHQEMDSSEEPDPGDLPVHRKLIQRKKPAYKCPHCRNFVAETERSAIVAGDARFAILT